jgi:hypothetical protein
LHCRTRCGRSHRSRSGSRGSCSDSLQ